MQSHKSWMKKGTKSEYDKTKPCKPISHEWKKEQKSKYDKTKPCKAISHEWKKEQKVNMTKLNHAKP